MITSEKPKLAMDGRYSIAEAAKILGVHRNTIRNYADAGRLPRHYRRFNNRAFFLGADLLRFWIAEI